MGQEVMKGSECRDGKPVPEAWGNPVMRTHEKSNFMRESAEKWRIGEVSIVPYRNQQTLIQTREKEKKKQLNQL